MHRLLFHAALITLGSHYLAKAAALGSSLMLITLGSSSAYKDQQAASKPLTTATMWPCCGGTTVSAADGHSSVSARLVQGFSLDPVATHSLPTSSNQEQARVSVQE